MNFDINEVIKTLKDERDIFTSERDFQLSLARAIETTYPNEATVRLEYCPKSNPDMHIDILVIWNEVGQPKWIPIELKYKTKEYSYVDDDGCIYDLKNQSAYDNGCYDYMKDISRIEAIKADNSELYKTGFAIFLTNDTCYKKTGSREKTNYDQFRIYLGREIDPKENREFKWDNSDKVSNNRKDSITLNGNYVFEWKEYSSVKNKSDEEMKFYILITRIPYET